MSNKSSSATITALIAEINRDNAGLSVTKGVKAVPATTCGGANRRSGHQGANPSAPVVRCRPEPFRVPSPVQRGRRQGMGAYMAVPIMKGGPEEPPLIDGSLSHYGFLEIIGSLFVAGFLKPGGSLHRLGFLLDTGSLYLIGFLKPYGSLLRFGFLQSIGSLRLCGFLSPSGSLDDIGFL